MADDLNQIVQRMIDAGEPEENIAKVIQAYGTQPAPAAPTQPGIQTRSALGTAKELGKGFIKSATRSVQSVADDLPHMFGGAGLGDYIDLISGRPQGTSAQMVREGAQNRNTPQMIGGLAETGTELGLPLVAGAEAFPRVGRAQQAFQDVMGAAKNVPLDLAESKNIAQGIKQFSGRGGGYTPRPVNQFLNRTNALQFINEPMKYEEGRDFASNIGRLSADESRRTNPNVKRLVGDLAGSLGDANKAAAESVGKGAQYQQAMDEYRRAMAVREALTNMMQGARKTLPLAAGGGAAGYYLGNKLRSLFEP